MLTTDVYPMLGSRRCLEFETWPQDIPDFEKNVNYEMFGTLSNV